MPGKLLVDIRRDSIWLPFIDKLGEKSHRKRLLVGRFKAVPREIAVKIRAAQPSSCFEEDHIILMCGWAGVAAITPTQWEQYLHQVHANSSVLVQRDRQRKQKSPKVQTNSIYTQSQDTLVSERGYATFPFIIRNYIAFLEFSRFLRSKLNQIRIQRYQIFLVPQYL